VWYRPGAKMPVTQITPARYWAIFRQPSAFDWMTALLPGYRTVKTDLSCPSPEPGTNWLMLWHEALRLNGTV
jgi:hypothetical protein